MKNLIVILSLMILTMFLGNEAKGQNSNLKNSNTELFTNQKRNVIKVDALSLLPGYLGVSYERSIAPNRSLHFNVGMLGMDFIGKTSKLKLVNQDGDTEKILVRPFGLVGNLGYRFYLFDLNLWSKPNDLKGFYLEPNVQIGQYHVNRGKYNFTGEGIRDYTVTSEKSVINYQAAMINGGYQAVFFKRLTLDMFMGLGIANDNVSESTDQYYFGEFHQGIYKPKEGTTLGVSLGIKAGFAF